MNLKFGDIRPYISKTEAIQIMVASNLREIEDNWSIREIEDSWPFKDLIPERYNDMQVIEFRSVHSIYIERIGKSVQGLEFFLDDIGHPQED